MNRGITIAIAVVFFTVAFATIRRRWESINCSNQMHAILFCAAKLWPGEHNGQLPKDFLSMSNELATPLVLICPDDHQHQPAVNWSVFTTNNCSYEIVSPGIYTTETNVIFLRCKIHNYVGYADDRLTDASGRLIQPNRFW